MSPGSAPSKQSEAEMHRLRSAAAIFPRPARLSSGKKNQIMPENGITAARWPRKSRSEYDKDLTFGAGQIFEEIDTSCKDNDGITVRNSIDPFGAFLAE